MMKPESKYKSNRKIGNKAEKLAEIWLIRNGYQIAHKNWFKNHQEIDLVVENAKYRVFVEVKFNNAKSMNFPESKINKYKRQFIQNCAQQYQEEFPCNKTIRFDIIAITQSAFSCQLFHMKDAFYGRHSCKSSNRLSHFYDIDFNVKRF